MYTLWYKTIDNKENKINFEAYEEAKKYWTDHFYDFVAIEICENDRLITVWDNARY